TPSRAYSIAAAAGALSGARSMAGPLAAAWATRGVPTHGLGRTLAPRAPLVSSMALGEALADKHPKIPPRVSPVPLLGRIAAGAALASHLGRDPKVGALLGGAAAGVSTQASFQARAKLAERLREPLPGLLEDALVGALAQLVASRGAARGST